MSLFAWTGESLCSILNYRVREEEKDRMRREREKERQRAREGERESEIDRERERGGEEGPCFCTSYLLTQNQATVPCVAYSL